MNLTSLIKGQKRKPRRIGPIRAVAPSHAAELMYKVQLLNIVKLLTAAKNKYILPVLEATEKDYGYAKDAANTRHNDLIQQAIDTAAHQFGGIQTTARRLAELAVRKQAEQTDKAFKDSVKSAIGIDISPIISSGQVGAEIEVATRANVALIKSIPQQYFDKIEQSIWTNTGQGMNYKAIAADLRRIDGVTESRAKFIARDQVGKINGAINQARQESAGINKYTWRTSQDERVRESHAEKEGEVFDWDNPPEDTGHPGEDYQCRCTAEPYFDLEALEAEYGIEAEEE